ncbi:hypothetical protein JZ751_003628 [Albula glossodonta]|uniref:Uncharacterized protein n=1 Tax=Albula glossodonta TaxID=121402 RepID=A0A8T2N775_9TELE|nr:hypothetical protein JZ751_003628 [Albula glossodonta]
MLRRGWVRVRDAEEGMGGDGLGLEMLGRGWVRVRDAEEGMAEVSLLRGARVISAEDILFLMRKDKVTVAMCLNICEWKKKVRRLLKYMQFRDFKSKIMKSIDDEDPLDSGYSSPILIALQDYVQHTREHSLYCNKYSTNVNKRQRLAQDFLSSIDQTGEFLTLLDEEEVDEVKQERLEVRATAT